MLGRGCGIKAVLEYKDFSGETNIVFKVLGSNNVEIIKTEPQDWSIRVLITIRVEDTFTLNEILVQLNMAAPHGVRIVKVKSERSFIERLRRFLA